MVLTWIWQTYQALSSNSTADTVNPEAQVRDTQTLG